MHYLEDMQPRSGLGEMYLNAVHTIPNIICLHNATIKILVNKTTLSKKRARVPRRKLTKTQTQRDDVGKECAWRKARK